MLWHRRFTTTVCEVPDSAMLTYNVNGTHDNSSYHKYCGLDDDTPQVQATNRLRFSFVKEVILVYIDDNVVGGRLLRMQEDLMHSTAIQSDFRKYLQESAKTMDVEALFYTPKTANTDAAYRAFWIDHWIVGDDVFHSVYPDSKSSTIIKVDAISNYPLWTFSHTDGQAVLFFYNECYWGLNLPLQKEANKFVRLYPRSEIQKEAHFEGGTWYPPRVATLVQEKKSDVLILN